MAARWPLGRDLTIGWLTPERTDLIETAIARGWPLNGMCPHPGCSRCEAVTADPPYVSDTVVFEFHPCGHRYWPQWRVPERKPSRFLGHPVSRPRVRWWHAIRATKRGRP